MEKEFWLERWSRQEIGFHQDEINTYLTQHWHELKLPQGSGVFVPLCGKSRDMQWLRDRGYRVVGVELSEAAVRAFFKENGYLPEQIPCKRFEGFVANDIHLVCGDFFDLCSTDLKGVTSVYDRASLVALPDEMRVRYANHLVSILPAGTQILLVTFDYPQAEMQGPPFSVSPGEVKILYGKYAEIRQLAGENILKQNPRFEARGLTRLQENVFLLTRR